MKNYDIVVLGGGPGGYVAAIKAKQLGASVALIEKSDIGGVCLNWGCIPTKALLKSAKVYKMMKHADDYGIDVANQDGITVNWKGMQTRKDGIVKKLTGGVKFLLDKNGVDIYMGLGNVVDSKTIEVNGETLKAKNLILATGASPIIPPIPGLKEGYEKGTVVTSKEILGLKEVPKRLTIIGGGVIGIEFATLYAALGTIVTIIERENDILMPVDDDIRSAFKKILKREKVTMLTETNAKAVEGTSVVIENKKGEAKIEGDLVLISVGMRPNLKGIEALNLKMSKAGVETDNFMRTSVKGVYAIGDMNGKVMLAHVASAEGILAVEDIFGKAKQPMDYNKVPSCIYGFPEIASVGLTERDARAQGINIKVGVFPLSVNGKALAEGESEGFVKIIADAQYNEVIGMHILAVNATDMIAEAVTTMELEGTADEIARAIHPHPTLSEIVMEAAHSIVGKAIHMV